MESTRHDTVRGAAPARGAANKVWILRAKDLNAEPFHFVGTPPNRIVKAATEEEARRIAAASHPAMAPAGFGLREVKLPEGAPPPKAGDPPRERERVAVEAHSPWTDPDLTSCEEPDLTNPGMLE